MNFVTHMPLVETCRAKFWNEATFYTMSNFVYFWNVFDFWTAQKLKFSADFFIFCDRPMHQSVMAAISLLWFFLNKIWYLQGLSQEVVRP